MSCHPLCKTNTFQCICLKKKTKQTNNGKKPRLNLPWSLLRSLTEGKSFFLSQSVLKYATMATFQKPPCRSTSVRSSKQVCPIDQSPDNILCSFPFCCVVMSLDVIAAMTLETGQPTFCLSDWTATLHWRLCYNS